jgi:streptogramin lyase
MAAALMAGCSSSHTDELQVSNNLTVPTPAVAPAAKASLPGSVVLTSARIAYSLLEPSTHSLITTTGSDAALTVYSVSDSMAAARTIALPAVPGQVSVASAGSVFVPLPSKKQVLTVDVSSGKIVSTINVTATPSYAASYHGKTLIGLPDARSLAVYENDTLVKTITGSVSPYQVLIADDKAIVLDRLRSALFDVDVDAGTFGAGIRAGDGAVNAVSDNYGRALITDARSGYVFALSPGPVLMRQSFPLNHTPYAIAYNAATHVAWVTETASNQVVALNMAAGQPTIIATYNTVQQPDSVIVDPTSGKAFVASATGGGIQVITPNEVS